MEQPEQKKQKDPIWKHARTKQMQFKTADELWDAAKEYFEWCDNNPVDAPISVVRYKKEKHGGSKEMKKQDQQENISRPYTLYGFCAFAGIRRWYAFKEKYVGVEGMDDFEDVIMAIENVVASQQIDGAMTGVFKENLASRLNGLADRNVQEVNGEVKSEVKFTGFGFLPFTPGLVNSEQSKIASGEVVEEQEPEYAEIIDYIPEEK